jgi:hypothetical protein
MIDQKRAALIELESLKAHQPPDTVARLEGLWRNLDLQKSKLREIRVEGKSFRLKFDELSMIKTELDYQLNEHVTSHE